MKKLLYLLMVVLIIFLGACNELPFNLESNEKELSIDEDGLEISRTIHGIIRQDETWRGQIHVVGDIIVERGYTLTIEPGTKITIAAKSDSNNLNTDEFNLKQGIREPLPGINPDYQGVHPGEPFRDEANHISIHILGTLHAVGTPDQRIIITSDSPDPEVWDWNAFTFNDGILSFCTLEYYRTLHTRHGIISNNVLRHVGECAVCIGPFDSGKVTVENNMISFAEHELIDIQGGNHIIRNNYLGPNPGILCHSGIVIVDGMPEICCNQIYGCKSGIVLIGGTPQIIDNYIIGCDEAFLYLSFADGFDIEDNYLINNRSDIIRNY
jgi:hypothetical protein